MISTRIVKLAASGLAIGLSLTGGHAPTTGQADNASEAKQMQMAALAATAAGKAMASGNVRAAVKSAEDAVAYQPNDPQYRLLLGQSYLSAGRFASAETAFSDVLTLSPDNSRAALNLALAEIAQGKRDRARSTLADYSDKLSATDFGLASALAGDVEGAVRALEAAIRDNGGDATTRQNLALAYAMQGNWRAARVMAMQDLAPEMVNDRIGQWASFVQSQGVSDQVASLLGVTPSIDSGQPAQLALAASPTRSAAAAISIPLTPAVPAAVVAATETSPVFETAAAGKTVAAVSPVLTTIETQTIVAMPQAEAALIRAEASPVKQFAAPAQVVAARATSDSFRAPKRFESGKYVVQLGAFESAAVSRDAWRRLSSRYSLTGYDPVNGRAVVKNATYVRLSIGGFATRSEATSLCQTIRNASGTCFVRGVMSDAPAYWVQRAPVRSVKPVRLASR